MKKTVWIAGLSFLFGLLVSGYLFVYHPEKNTSAGRPALPSLSSPIYASPAPQAKADLDFATISEKVGPAVVRIEVEKVEKRRIQGFGQDSPFDDFWDRFFGQPSPREQEYRSKALGTGFFISSDGYIMTNNHIAENSAKVTIFTVHGDQYTAKVIGTDPRTDLALVKIDIKSSPFVEFGDSAALKVGEWVMAIGNPLGMEHTVTAGIVSAKGRQLGGGESGNQYEDFIQTDAAINRGNSGGPLVNMKGEVVGINSNILTPTGGNIGIGFAIPSNMAKKVIPQLKEKGRVIRGKLGVTIAPVTEDVRKLLKLRDRNGALVNSVEAGGPAEKAGLKRYDIVTGINGQSIKDNNDLRFKIADIEPGKKVQLNIIRDGKEMTLAATTEELDPQEDRAAPESSSKDIGLSVTKMTPNLARRYGYKTTDGLLITEVKNYSPAAEAGLQAGDIILEINRAKVNSVNELEGVLRGTKSGDAVMLLIRRETEGESQDSIVIVKVP